jgi:hypothetical protein
MPIAIGHEFVSLHIRCLRFELKKHDQMPKRISEEVENARLTLRHV